MSVSVVRKFLSGRFSRTGASGVWSISELPPPPLHRASDEKASPVATTAAATTRRHTRLVWRAAACCSSSSPSTYTLPARTSGPRPPLPPLRPRRRRNRAPPAPRSHLSLMSLVMLFAIASRGLDRGARVLTCLDGPIYIGSKLWWSSLLRASIVKITL